MKMRDWIALAAVFVPLITGGSAYALSVESRLAKGATHNDYQNMLLESMAADVASIREHLLNQK